MQGRTGVYYWLVAGAAVGFGLIGLMSIGLPFLLAGLVMVVVGVWKPGIGMIWAFPIGLGGLPSLVFLGHIGEAVRTALNPYCWGDARSGGISLPPGEGPVLCSYVPASYYVMFAISLAIALSGVALYLMLRARSRSRAPAQEAR